MARTSASLVAPLLAALLLAGCAGGQPAAAPSETPTATPTPSATARPAPTPTRTGPPPLGELVLSPEGLGTLVIGQPIDPELATFDPHGCRTAENQDLYPADDPVWEAWLPNYSKEQSAVSGYPYEYYPFEPHHDSSGVLTWLMVRSPEIRTAEGIGLGSTEAEVRAAYPGAVVWSSDAWVEGELPVVAYGVEGDAGRLVLEVTEVDRGEGGASAGTVFSVRVDPLEWELRSISGGDAGGFCAVEV